MRFIKPLDEDLIRQLAKTHSRFVTVEDNAIMGGAGSAVCEFLNKAHIHAEVLQLGLPDIYQEHASREELLAEAGIDSAGMQNAIANHWP